MEGVWNRAGAHQRWWTVPNRMASELEVGSPSVPRGFPHTFILSISVAGCSFYLLLPWADVARSPPLRGTQKNPPLGCFSWRGRFLLFPPGVHVTRPRHHVNMLFFVLALLSTTHDCKSACQSSSSSSSSLSVCLSLLCGFSVSIFCGEEGNGGAHIRKQRIESDRCIIWSDNTRGKWWLDVGINPHHRIHVASDDWMSA